MGLAVYRRKRNFKSTPEPRGARRRPARTALSYFIQKHAASRLHYDLRLELDGVLKSWAVPKGPSLDPGERRLAVRVEDHPLEYGTFEGEIPRGEYGAGTVRLWDRGEWIPEGDPREAYRKGHLRFRLEGRKLRGAWTLVAMGGAAGEDGKNWLLIKAKDEAARALAAGDVQVQLATLAAKAPVGTGWVHEIKLDGYRILAEVSGGKAVLRSRRGNDWTRRFRAAASALEALPARTALLDGEIVLFDEKGRSDFQRLQNALGEGGADRAVYCAFDLLFLDGRDLRDLPLKDRKAALKTLLEKASPRLRYVEHIAGTGADEVLKQACALGLEGIICKREDAPYRSGRTDDWLKVKCLREQEFVIGGFTEPAGSRAAFGALVLGVHDDGGGLRYAGRVGTGFTQGSLREIRRKLLPLETGRAAFSKPPTGADARGVHWVRPELVAQVAFSEWTKDGVLRQPSFKGLREDKPASVVTRERPLNRPVVAGVRITHPDRVVYPGLGVTKLELARYYEAAAERMLPLIARRPLAIVRCPEGGGKPCFYQKRAGRGFPEPVRGTDEFLYVSDLAGLISLVQFGVLEFHPWACRVGDIERPDYMTFDLDPGSGTAWTAVLSAAREIRDRFARLGRETFVKTTGGKGLHVVVPLTPAADWAEVKAFAKAFAGLLAAEFPSRYTIRPAKAGRSGRIYVDYLRNERGATSVCAYSTRARPGAPVSMPVAWDELKPSRKPGGFNVRSAPARLARGRDPWSGFDAARRPLPRP